MTMSAMEPAVAPAAGFRWSWLWSARRDLAWNLAPFWLGFAVLGALFLTLGDSTGYDTIWAFTFSGHQIHILTLGFLVFGPLVDGPHLWATIARTYTDAVEWGERRKLFLTSLLAFAVGPAIILIPYLIDAVVPIPAYMLDWGWNAWGVAFTFYALYHINKQHWGFVSLYRRKNDDAAGEARIDSLFFNTAIWLPYVAMMSVHWDGSPGTYAISPARMFLFQASHVLFLSISTAYVLFQVSQWRKGVVRNGPKLLYVATVIPLYYLTFAWDPRIAGLWVLITTTGHCAQYHALVWAYGKKRYAAVKQAGQRLPHLIFTNFWLYAALALLYALFTLQGPGAGLFKETLSGVLQGSVFTHAFTYLNASEGRMLGVKVAAALIAGVRLHHFYVDSKIWRVSKNKGLAKDLSV